MMEEVGRNDPCPCGSGLKYKKCCWGKPPKPKFKAKVIKSGSDFSDVIGSTQLPKSGDTFKMTDKDFRVTK